MSNPARFDKLVENLILDLVLLKYFAGHGQSVAILAAIDLASQRADSVAAAELLDCWISGRTIQ